MKPLQVLLALFAFAFLPLHAASLDDLTYITTDGEVAIDDCDTAATGVLVIPATIEGNPVTSIRLLAFFYCSSLTSITIPNGVTSIGSKAFGGCSSLTTIEVGAENSNYADLNGVLFNKEKTDLLTYPEGKVGNYTIPDGVTSIGERAFRDCTNLTSITIPDSVESIGNDAFFGCDNLTSITIPDGVTSIGNYAFALCTSLTSITIPNGVTSIGSKAFGGCSSLTTIEVGAENSNYADLNGVLFNKEKTDLLTYPEGKVGNYTIPDGVTSIESDAFRDCTSLTSITIPDSVTSIGDGAFRNCIGLRVITIPYSVTSIGDFAFYSCTSLTSITIPDSVTSIGDDAFSRCTSLTSISIPDSVNSIGDYAFNNCGSLTSITIPDGVTSIGYGAFSFCPSLTSITIPDGVTSIGGAAFFSCTSLTNITIPDGVTSIGANAFRSCTSLTSITIPDSVTSIGDQAFYYCTSLTSITIQGVAPTVGTNAFSNTPDGAVALVTSANLVSFGENGSSWNGLTLEVIPVLSWITNNGEVTITDCDTAATGELIIPDTIEGNPVTSIGNDAFRDCGSLTSVTIPGSVTSIGVAAFRDCTSLTSMTIPDSVTSIGGAAFYQCTGLTNITIPDGVTSIGNGTFRGCISLTSITIPNGVTSIGNYAFRDCTSLTSVNFQGVAPTMNIDVFLGVKDGAVAYVSNEGADSFGGFGNTWEGLMVAIQRVTITDCGFVNATTYFIEFEPAGAGYRVMSSPTLNFGNAVEVTPTLQPTGESDNRFEFTASGSRNFYQLEPTE